MCGGFTRDASKSTLTPRLAFPRVSGGNSTQRERTAEYGVTIFQIGPNKISRPLCAPYVGWICSWDGSSGIVHDLDGNVYQYVPITDTSYGEPAGIFASTAATRPILSWTAFPSLGIMR